MMCGSCDRCLARLRCVVVGIIVVGAAVALSLGHNEAVLVGIVGSSVIWWAGR